MITQEAIKAFETIHTPFYYYDMDLLNKTLQIYTSLTNKYGYSAHYALKANANPKILSAIQKAGLGADCVSGNEVALAVKSGFPAEKIVYAGVGKSDMEIKTALKAGIFSFNCESVPEIKIINDLAASMGKVAHIALRINPDIDAHTHKYISTGRKEDKFGISPWMFEGVAGLFESCNNIKLMGLHFHVGSQILVYLLSQQITPWAKQFSPSQEKKLELSVLSEIVPSAASSVYVVGTRTKALAFTASNAAVLAAFAAASLSSLESFCPNEGNAMQNASRTKRIFFIRSQF